MVLTAYFALSPVIGLSCHRRWWKNFRQLDAGVEASGPHDFAVRAQCHSSFDMPRPPHPAPYVRDDRETPLCVGRDGDGCRSDLRKMGTEIFLRRGLDRCVGDLPVGQSADCSVPAKARQLPDGRAGFRRRRCATRYGGRDLTIARLRNTQRVSSSLFRAADLCCAAPLAPSSWHASGAHDPSAAC